MYKPESIKIRNSIITFTLVFLFPSMFNTIAQDSIAIRYSKTITAGELKEHLYTLASDEYEGRETGKKGQKLAERYIEKHFKGCGLPPVVDKNTSYLQVFELEEVSWGKPIFEIEGKQYEWLKDFYAFSRYNNPKKVEASELLFLGYGIEDEKYNDYENAEVKDKVLVILNGEPKDKEGKYLTTGTEVASVWSFRATNKLKLAQDKGARAVLVIDAKHEASIKDNKRAFTHSSVQLTKDNKEPDKIFSHAFISTAMAEKLFENSKLNLEKLKKQISKKGTTVTKPFKSNVSFTMEQKVTPMLSSNVLGYVEGSDLKDELILVTAHYDHIGVDEDKIFNGADDDGSGTVAVLEMAEAFAEAKKDGYGPRRSMLFMPVSGEEKGLLGSRYYSDNPVFPLENTVADLNIDMIGRIDEKHKGNPDYVYIIGSDMLSSELHKINEEMNKTYANLELDYTFNKKDDPNRYYYRSDHYNFAKNNIPVIFYFNGVHEDYHKHTDTVEKIDFEKIEKISRLIFFTAWELANRDKRIVVDTKEQ